MSAKILYVLPEYDRATFTNAHHLLEMVEEAAKMGGIELFIERAERSPDVKNIQRVYLQKKRSFPFRFLERAWIFLRFRMKGGKNIYVHGSYGSAIIASLVMRPTGGRVYYWQCEKFEDYGKDISPGMGSWVRWKLLNDWPLRITLRAVHVFVTGTKSIGERYSALFKISPSKIAILPNGVDLNRLKPLAHKKSSLKKILFVHWFSPRKGILELSEIIERVVEKEKKVAFILVGEGPSEKELMQTLKKKNLDRVVEKRGKVPNLQLEKLFEEADLFIMPSRQEGIPRVLLESMAWGVPFVSTDVGGVSEIVSPEQQACLVPPMDPAAFSDKVVQLLNDPEERERLRKLGFEQVKRYDQKVVAEQFIALFDSK